jgi:hypothetical protein
MTMRTIDGSARVGLAFLLALSVLFLASCSGSGTLHPVRGQVLYKDAPAKGAVVTFHPKGDTSITAQHPSGVTGEDGSFTLTTGPKNGASAGEYVVTIEWYEEVAKPTGIVRNRDDQTPPKDRLEGRYAKLANSKLTAQVKSGNNQLEPFRLD